MRTVIIQRVVPHYRTALFDRLYRELGWVIASASDAPHFGLNTARAKDWPWLHAFDFGLDPKEQYNAVVPVSEIIDELAPDAIVAEFSLRMSSTWRLSLARRSRRPLLAYWSQGRNVERGFTYPRDIASQIMRLLLMARSDAQICYSKEGADYLRRWLPRRQGIFVAPNTLSVNEMVDRDVDLSPANPAEARLVWIGRITHDKRVPMLVEAFGKALARMPSLHLTIVGDGPDMTRVQDRAARLPQGSITLAGAEYDEARTAAILRGSSLYVSAGSVGLGVNHALAYGVPVMLFDKPRTVSHHPEHCYVVDDVSGYRVADDSVAGLSAALIRVLGRPISPKVELRTSLRDHFDRQMSMENLIAGFRQLDDFFRSR